VLTVLVRTEGAVFVPAARDDLPALLATDGALVWVDLEDPTADEVAVLSAVFHFHPLTIDDCLNQYVDPPKVDDYRDYLFITVQAMDLDAREGGDATPPQAGAPSVAGTGGAARSAVRTTELDLYLGRTYVVSFHRRPLASIAEVADRCARGAPQPARSAAWLAHALLDTVVDHVLPVVETLDEEIAALEDEALHAPEESLVQRMITLKHGVLRLRRLVAPQRDVVNRLARGDYPPELVPPETLPYFRDIYDHLVRLEDMIEALRDLGDNVIATYLATLNNRLAATNNRLNEIMKVLSIVGTIFLPLTLVASVFGTNFASTYEGAGWWGFTGMVVLMLVVSVAAIAWFRRRRWL
jgi:magnesium transporter